MKIDVLTVNGVFDTGLAAVLDAFATANELAVAQGLKSVAFDVSVVGLRRQVRTNQGFSIAAAVGYADGVALRNLLRRKLGRGVREIRSERAARL
jgi:hypothetical protein